MNNLPPMTLFDYMVSSRENNMLKAFLPYIDRDFQPMLATYIKYTELLATIDLFSEGRNVFNSKSESFDFTDIISIMLPYVPPEQQEIFENIKNIKNTMEMFEAYKDMMTPDIMNMFNGFDTTDESNQYNKTHDDPLNNND